MVLPKDCCTQLQITIMSAQSKFIIGPQLENILPTVDVTHIRKVQIANIINRENSVVDFEYSASENEIPATPPDLMAEDNNMQDNFKTFIEYMPINDDSFYLECFFKIWLQDCATDKEHCVISFPACKDGGGSDLSLKCDFQDRLVNPDITTVCSKYSLVTDTVSMQISNNASNKIQVYDFEVLSTLGIDGICESLLFGNSYIIYPTHCWKIDWEELETNQQHFYALNEQLSQMNRALLVKRGCKTNFAKNSSNENNLFCYYIIFPAKNQTMLLKSVVSKELMLPNNQEFHLEDIVPPEEVRKKVGHCISSLNHINIFNPLKLTSGLYSHLQLPVKRVANRAPSVNAQQRKKMKANLSAMTDEAVLKNMPSIKLPLTASVISKQINLPKFPTNL